MNNSVSLCNSCAAPMCRWLLKMKISKKKLNLKLLNAKPMACWENGDAPTVKTGNYIAIASFIGFVTSIKSVESAYSDEPQNAFIGAFEGVNLLTGETENGNILYLPDLARMIVENKMMKGNGRAQFDLTIGAERALKQDGSMSFTYVVEDNAEGEEADPLAELRKQRAARLNPPASARAAVTDQSTKTKAKAA